MTTENSQDVTQAAGEARQAAEETEKAAITLAQAIANAKAHFKPLTDAIGNVASVIGSAGSAINGFEAKVGGVVNKILMATPGVRTLYSGVISLGESFDSVGLLLGHFGSDLGNIARNFVSTNSYTQRLAAGMRYVGESFAVVRDLGIGLNTHLESISEKVNVLTGAVGKAFQTLTGASSVTELVTKVVAANAALGDLSDKTGIATQDLQAWGNIADLSGGKADDMQQGMAKVAEEMNTLKNGGEKGNALKFFESMGVSVTDASGKLRDQKDLMLDMAGQMQGMSQMDVMAKAKDSGLNESQLAVMQQGRAELEAMLTAQQANSQVTEQQAKRAQDLQQAWTLVQQSVGSLSNDFVNDIGPALTLFMDGLRAVFDYLKQHRGLLYGIFIGLAVAMGPAIFASISLAAGVLGVTWPLLALGAAIGLVIDWFIAWQNGTESTIGSVIGWFAKLLESTTIFKFIAGLVDDLSAAWKALTGQDFSFSGMLDGLAKIGRGCAALLDNLSVLWRYVKALFGGDDSELDKARQEVVDTYTKGRDTKPVAKEPLNPVKYKNLDEQYGNNFPPQVAGNKKQFFKQPIGYFKGTGSGFGSAAKEPARILNPAPSARPVTGTSGARAQAQLTQPTQVTNTTTNSTSVHNQFGVINIHTLQDGQRMGNEFVSTVNASLKSKGANPYAFNSA